MSLINFIPDTNVVQDTLDSSGNVVGSLQNDTGYNNFNSRYGNAATQALGFVQSMFNNLFANPYGIQLNITVKFDTHVGKAAVGTNDGGNTVKVSYADVVNALKAVAQDGLQTQTYNALPSTDPLNGTSDLYLTPAYAAELGLYNSPTPPQPGQPLTINDTIWINSNLSDDWSGSTSLFFGQLVGTIEHELTEIMGRISYDGNNSGPGTPQGYTPMDLWRYSAPGQPEIATQENGGPPIGYFSVDGGKTNLSGGYFNNAAGSGDYADYIQPVISEDTFGVATLGTPSKFSLQDLQMLNVMGWSTNVNISDGIFAQVPFGVVDWVGPKTVTIPGTSTNILAVDLSSNRVVYGWLDVGNGGTASSDYIETGGVATVEKGGIGDTIYVLDGGSLEVQFGGITKNIFVYSGANETIDVGGITTGFHVYAGSAGQEDDGTANNGTVDGNEIVTGSATAVTITTGGTQTLNGGLTTSSVLDGGTEVVLAGTADQTIVDGNGFLNLEGGQATDTIVNGKENILDATDDGAAVFGNQNVFVQGFASNAIVHGLQDVSLNGTSLNSTIVEFGREIVEDGGTAGAIDATGKTSEGTIVTGNNLQIGLIVNLGGNAYGTLIQFLGTENVAGNDTGADIFGTQNVDQGTTTNAVVEVGGKQIITGGITVNTTIKGGGTVFFTSGSVSGTVIKAEGTEFVGGTDDKADVYGLQEVDLSGSATNAKIEAGGVQHVIANGTATNTTVLLGGILNVEDGGKAINPTVYGKYYLNGVLQADPTTVEVGGQEIILSLGVDTGALIYGSQDVFGSAFNTILFAGSIQTVESGGAVTGTTLQGGTLDVLTGGIANSSVIGNGAILNVSSGGIVTNTTINGGILYVASGGSSIGVTVSNGGVFINVGSYSTSITLPSTSTGNLGLIGTNANTFVDASQTNGIAFKIGNGNDAVILGTNDTLYSGAKGNDQIIGGSNDTIYAGGGNNNINVGANSTIFAGNGNDIIKAGDNSKITVGNGNDSIFAGANSLIKLGNGTDTVAFEGASIGSETINGFNPTSDTLRFNTSLLANYMVALGDMKQVGLNTVIQIDANNSVTLDNVTATSLSLNSFQFK
jgi:autotransporter passenger strand-loop-strand repeat protein